MDAITHATTEPTGAPPLDYRNVLVAVDGSTLGELALPPGAWLARLLGAELHAVSVRPPLELLWYEGYLTALATRWPELTVHEGHGDDTAAGILAVAGELAPTLLCMATHGWSRAAPIFGAAFATVTTRVTDPVVAIGTRSRAPKDEGPRRIVAALDGSRAAEAILPDAVAWATRFGWQLSLVTVAEPGPTPIVPGAHRYRAHGPDDPDAYLTGLLERPELAAVGADATVVWDPISPEAGLLDHLESRPATMVAVTTHARHGVSRLLLGSRAAEVVHVSPVPVLVRPLPGRSDAGRRSGR